MWVGRGIAVLCLAATACSVGPAPGVEKPSPGEKDSGTIDAPDAGRDPQGGSGGAAATGGMGGTGGSDDDAGEPPPDSGPPDAGPPDAGPPDAGPDDPDTCPGVPVVLSGSPLTAVFSESSLDYGFDYIPTTACSSTSGDEAVYRLRAPADGMLRVTLDTPSAGATYAPQLYVRSPSCELGPELACDSRPSFLSDAVVEIPVSMVVDYFFFADEAVGGTDGPFTLTFLYL
jgi:hypothetical protein